RDFFVTRLLPVEPRSAPELEALLRDLVTSALAEFADEGVPPARVRFQRYATMRYENQEHGVEVPLPDGAVEADLFDEVAKLFHSTYEREYTYRLDAPIELVAVHLVAVAEVGKLRPAQLPRTGRSFDHARKPQRTVDYAAAGVHLADVYTGELLEPGAAFAGPAVIETKGSTLRVPPACATGVDPHG